MKKSIKILLIVIVLVIGGLYVKTLFNDKEENVNTSTLLAQEGTTEIQDNKEENEKNQINEQSTNENGTADGEYVRMLRIDEIENLGIAITREIQNISNSEDYDVFTTDTGEEMKILLNATRADYYSDKDVNKAIDESIEFIHALMNYNGENEIYFLKRLTSYVNGNMNSELHLWIDSGKFEYFSQGKEEGDFYNGKTQFPLEAYKELLKNVANRKLQSIDIYESEEFSEPYLDLIATIATTTTFNNGETETQKHKFYLTFNNQIDNPRRIHILKIEKVD